jgi:serine/threonine-protein kinase
LFNGEVTARSDIYSFGLVLAYACLGQRIDMGGSQVEVIEKRRKLPDLSQVYPEIRPLLARMLQPDPTLRPANMREVAHWRPEAKPAADEATIIRLTQPTAPPNRLQPLASTKAPGGGSSRNAKLAMKMRSPLWGASALALLVAMALGATLFVRRSSAPPNEPLPAPQLSAAPPIEPDPSALEKGAATPGERLSGFIVHFDLGACAFMVPIKIDDASARIDGFGLDAKPFEAFDKVFTRATNIEADVKVRQITRAQCPAADFLAKLGAGGPDSPRLSLRQTSLRSGDVFSGEVASDQPNLELMIVDEDGKTYNVTSQMRTGAADRPFAMRLKKKAAAAQAHSLLLIAVGSAAPLQALKAANGVGADALFRAIAEETAGQPDVRATAVSFQIE